MKYLKIMAAMLAAVTVASCSNDDEKREINTNKDVTVSMANAEITFRENKGVVTIPMVVSGESNGYITVTCSVREYGDEPAMANVHYYLTSDVVNIEPGATEAAFEIATVDDSDPNPNRTFIIKIESAIGATVANPNETIVTLRDNDTHPYDRIGGEWKTDCLDINRSPTTALVKFESYDEGELGYKTFYDVSGLSAMDVRVEFDMDETTEEGELTFVWNSGTFVSGGETIAGTLLYDWSTSATGTTATFVWNKSFTELTLVKGPAGMDYCSFLTYSPTTGDLYRPGCQEVTKFYRD